MPISLSWTDIAVRLALTVLAGLIIGYDRSEHGKAAGMRTTLLVCLAAAVAMIQVNLLLPTAGRAADSFVMNDLMRLPLGILTGMGFIGGGAILRRGDIVTGVTTAATLWLITVVGLCLGGGQIALGIVATLMGFLALTLLRWIEDRLPREHGVSLTLDVAPDGPTERDIRTRLAAAGLAVAGARVVMDRERNIQRFSFKLKQLRTMSQTESPPLIGALTREIGILAVDWRGDM